MSDYSRFFGPLAGRLHVVLERRPSQSSYHFPGLGRVCFVRDADAHDPLVMLASLVGKYVRELLMRKSRSPIPEALSSSPSGRAAITIR